MNQKISETITIFDSMAILNKLPYVYIWWHHTLNHNGHSSKKTRRTMPKYAVFSNQKLHRLLLKWWMILVTHTCYSYTDEHNLPLIYTNKHTYIHAYMYVYIYVCVVTFIQTRLTWHKILLRLGHSSFSGK